MTKTVIFVYSDRLMFRLSTTATRKSLNYDGFSYGTVKDSYSYHVMNLIKNSDGPNNN